MLGWNLDNNIPKNIKKCVIVQAPHTSNWDFVIGKLAAYQFGIKPNIFIKKSLFFFPLGILLKKLGGIPVDRSSRNNIVEEIAYQLTIQDELLVLLTPEGTRSYNPNWKKGFYYIAKASRTPVIPAYIDFNKKRIGFTTEFELTDDVNADIETLKNYFRPFKGKYPENGIR